MNDKDKHFIERYEELLNKGYCDCNEMNCIDNNSPRRILDIVKQLQSNWNSLREFFEIITNYYMDKRSNNNGVYIQEGMERFRKLALDKMNKLEKSGNK